MTEQPRPGDQPLPTPGEGPGCHDLVIADLRAGGDPGWDAVADFLEQRKAVGLERYGTVLQPGNGRDVLRDLAEELGDAIVYARQALLEGHPTWMTEDMLVDRLERVLQMRAAAVNGGAL